MSSSNEVYLVILEKESLLVTRKTWPTELKTRKRQLIQLGGPSISKN